ncbi:hypothetical protein [Endozoicomonas montiporae]|uniref:hypothetical protein n=1 Tax=Endozoicomonas montiporae TaxID=1027273 RepID=UPI001C9DE0EE|nr:hypothetical protein [Endozoicomonas montiporae]
MAIDSGNAEAGDGDYHLVEANLDIESRDDRTLCTEVLHGNFRYEVLTNHLLSQACPICSAILKRRISNMPLERKGGALNAFEEVDEEVPETQMALILESGDQEQEELDTEVTPQSHSPQFELFG